MDLLQDLPMHSQNHNLTPLPPFLAPSCPASSLPTGYINHPLPPKPPTSKLFIHAYHPPARDLRISPDNNVVPHCNDGEYLPLNGDAENTSLKLESDSDEASSIDVYDLPHPDTLFSWAQDDHNMGNCEVSVPPWCADNGICHAETNSDVFEILGTGSSRCESHSVVDKSDKDGNGPTKRSGLDGSECGEGIMLDVTQSKTCSSSPQAASAELRPPKPGHADTQLAALDALSIATKSF